MKNDNQPTGMSISDILSYASSSEYRLSQLHTIADEAQIAEHITETTPIIMNDNNPTTEAQTTEHPKTTPIIMNDNNQPTEAQTATEKLTNLIIELALGRGSRIVSSLTKINDYVEIGLNRKADHAFYNLARNISKRLFENPTDRAVESVCNTLELSSSVIIDAVTNIKQTAKPRTRGIVSDLCVQYAVSTVRGDILRSNRVASSLEGCALRLCASNDRVNGTVIMSEALDKALSKVYAAVRSQAKTNGVDIGGKSNTATKTAAKTAILEELLRLKIEDSYQFDVIIGEVKPLSGQ